MWPGGAELKYRPLQPGGGEGREATGRARASEHRVPGHAQSRRGGRPAHFRQATFSCTEPRGSGRAYTLGSAPLPLLPWGIRGGETPDGPRWAGGGGSFPTETSGGLEMKEVVE